MPRGSGELKALTAPHPTPREGLLTLSARLAQHLRPCRGPAAGLVTLLLCGDCAVTEDVRNAVFSKFGCWRKPSWWISVVSSGFTGVLYGDPGPWKVQKVDAGVRPRWLDSGRGSGGFNRAFITHTLFYFYFFFNSQQGLLGTDPVPEAGEDAVAAIGATETLSEEEQEELRRELAKVQERLF